MAPVIEQKKHDVRTGGLYLFVRRDGRRARFSASMAPLRSAEVFAQSLAPTWYLRISPDLKRSTLNKGHDTSHVQVEVHVSPRITSKLKCINDDACDLESTCSNLEEPRVDASERVRAERRSQQDFLRAGFVRQTF